MIATRTHYTKPDVRAAFTLVELLVTIAIISILATALLGAASLAGGTAREARTKARILRIHPLLMEHYDTYKNRRVELHSNMEDLVTAAAPKDQGKVRALYRLRAARELMKMEIPDRWSDIWLNSLNLPQGAPQFNAERTGLSEVYLRKYRQLLAKVSAPNSTVTVEDIVKNQGAECLYLVIMNATADGEARSLFSEQTIGDTDGDGAQEFIDGWGNPIEFLRWAPAYRSDLQLSAGQYGTIFETLNTEGSQAVEVALASDPDPFDIYRVDQSVFSSNLFRGFRLVPVIYSAGADEEYGILNDIRINPPLVNVNSDPYHTNLAPPVLLLLGEILDPSDSVHVDNITNHLIVGN